MDLPGEPFAYSIYLGDYHAPLSSFYLLSLGVLCGVLWQRTRQKRYINLLGGTLTWSILANSWSLPLQGLAIGLWALANYRDWRKIPLGLVYGAALVWLAANVYLAHISLRPQPSIRRHLSSWHLTLNTAAVAFLIFSFSDHRPLALLKLMFRPRAATWLGAAWSDCCFFPSFSTSMISTRECMSGSIPR